MSPSEHLLSAQSAFWITDIGQMNQVTNAVESVVIQGCVARDDDKPFTLANLPSLISLEIGCGAFYDCHSVVLDSMSD